MKVIPPIAADYAGEKGMLDKVIVIWQDGIRRDAIARERGVEVSEPVIEPDEMINYD